MSFCSISFQLSLHSNSIIFHSVYQKEVLFLFARLCSDRVARNALVFTYFSSQERSSFQLSGLIVDLKALCVLSLCCILDISNKYDILLLLQFRQAIISQETFASCVSDNNKFSSELCMVERSISILSYLLAFISRAVVQREAKDTLLLQFNQHLWKKSQRAVNQGLNATWKSSIL